MAVIGASSTIQQVEAAFDNAASYLENNSTSQARTLITTGSILLRRYPQQSTHGPVTMRRDLALLRDLISEARRFLLDRDEDLQGPKVSHVDFTDYRRGLDLEPDQCR